MKPITKTFSIAGRPFSFETGSLAGQADSAVLARYGDTVVLATVVASKEKSSLDYFPLQVEYAERLYAGGRIKGSRWIKREGRPSDEIILNARLIDRSIRPLFPKAYHHDVQVVATILSVDKENDPDMVAMLGVSTALALSPIPWNGPIAAVRVGLIDDQLVVNPQNGEMEKSKLDLVVSGTGEKVVMIEAGAQEVPEEKMIEAIQLAHAEIKKIVAEITGMAKERKVSKHAVEKDEKEELIKQLEKTYHDEITAIFAGRAAKKEGANTRYQELRDKLEESFGEAYGKRAIESSMEKVFEKHVRKQILTKEVRVDGRALTEIRPLSIEVGKLPRTHGSALFQRGNTQALTVTTLGSPSMEQWLESAEGEDTKRYIHHYNMPPYSVGETGRMGYPSRREIGHGALAERALEPVIPGEDKFPYTIRVVSEILSSNGSTSMASTCGSTLSLMDAGVPISAPVAGISIGLVAADDEKEYKLLTDIMGIEDFYGDMDFKVAGTRAGVTAIQLDVKTGGLNEKVIRDTFAAARTAREHILDKMLAVIPVPRDSVSTYAPKIMTFLIPVDKIGEIIGPGGKVIRQIIAETGSEINVEDDGVVTVANQDKEAMQRAVSWIQNIIRQVEPGEKFEGPVKRILPFGAFVEILPGKEGLVHLSRMSTEYVKEPTDVVQIGQVVKVRVVEIDEQGRTNLSMITPEEEQARRMSRPTTFGRQRDGRDRDRGGGRGRGGDQDWDRKRQQGSNQRYEHPHLKNR